MQVDIAVSENPQSVNDVDTAELSVLQWQESDFLPIFEYLEKGVLPEDERQVRQLALERPRFSVIEGVLHYENPDLPGVTRIAVPSGLRQKLLQEAHAGCFAGHFAERKIYTSLRKQYWRDKMRADIVISAALVLCVPQKRDQGGKFVLLYSHYWLEDHLVELG